MSKWIEEGDSAYYCIDLDRLLSYNNIKWFILGNKLYSSLYDGLEEDIEVMCDMLLQHCGGLRLEEAISFINSLGISYDCPDWNTLEADTMVKHKVVGILTRLANAKLSEFIGDCLKSNRVFSNTETLNRVGSLDNLFYKNGY